MVRSSLCSLAKSFVSFSFVLMLVLVATVSGEVGCDVGESGVVLVPSFQSEVLKQSQQQRLSSLVTRLIIPFPMRRLITNNTL
jgi:hypothetical protein